MHLHKFALQLPLCLFLIIGCKSEVDNKPAAKVEPAAPATPAAAPATPAAAPATPAAAPAAAPAAPATPVQGKTLPIDRDSSKVEFVGAKVTGDHTGSFKDFTGEAVIDGKTPKSVTFTVQTASVTSDDDKLTGHLKSADFFDAEKFKTATFKSTSIVEKKQEKATHEITGELELHGVKKSVTFPADITVGDKDAKGKAEFTINRKDFGIVYPGKPDDLIKDAVLLKLDLKFDAEP